jgi:hypothetical protein
MSVLGLSLPGGSPFLIYHPTQQFVFFNVGLIVRLSNLDLYISSTANRRVS